MPTDAQIKKIFAGAREARMPEEDLRDLVEQVSGQRSTRKLSVDEAKQVIDALVAFGARKGKPRRKASGTTRAPGVTPMLSPAQRTYIADLRRKLGADWLRAEYFEGACRKVIHKPAPLTSADASRVIEMLRARLAHDRPREPKDGSAA